MTNRRNNEKGLENCASLDRHKTKMKTIFGKIEMEIHEKKKRRKIRSD